MHVLNIWYVVKNEASQLFCLFYSCHLQPGVGSAHKETFDTCWERIYRSILYLIIC